MNELQADISVIIRTAGRPTYYLNRALASVRAQTLRPSCVIVSNDSRSDLSPVELDVGELPLVCLNRDLTEPLGEAAASNRALKRVQTTWFAFLDDDDTWSSDCLGRLHAMAASLANDSNLGGVCCRTGVIYEEDDNGRFSELGREPFNPDLQEITCSGLAERNRFTNNAVLWHRRVFSVVGGFREDLPVLDDWEYNVRVATRFRIAVLPIALANYHQRPRAVSAFAANSPAEAHDRFRLQLLAEWRKAGILPPDRGWNWLVNRWTELRRRVARQRFRSRWRRSE